MVERTLSPLRREIMSRVQLTERILDETLMRARVEADDQLCATVEDAIASVERIREATLGVLGQPD